jgi:hypothetical protein
MRIGGWLYYIDYFHPTEVTRTALQNAASISAVMFNTEALQTQPSFFHIFGA